MKAVIFDFDGTLTVKRGNLWKRIWKELGYDIGPDSYYISVLKSFLNNEITHKEWCDITLKAFQEKHFTREMFDKIVSDITLINGAVELIKYLYSKGIEIHIVSGNIINAIHKVLADNVKYMTAINANNFIFDNSGIISDIIGTKYDFEGKSTYIKELCSKKGYLPSDILFIGNSMNDEWVYESGANTLCVNPDNTKSENSTIWNKVVYTDNLMDLIKEIKLEF